MSDGRKSGEKGWQYCSKHGRNYRTDCGKCVNDDLRARLAAAEADRVTEEALARACDEVVELRTQLELKGERP